MLVLRMAAVRVAQRRPICVPDCRAALCHCRACRCVVPVDAHGSAKGVRTPSAWGVLTGRVPIHTRTNPRVGPNTPAHRRHEVYNFVLNADALLPLRRLFVSFGVVAFSYYWFQVYTRTLSFDLSALLDTGADSEQKLGFFGACCWQRRGVARARSCVALRGCACGGHVAGRQPGMVWRGVACSVLTRVAPRRLERFYMRVQRS